MGETAKCAENHRGFVKVNPVIRFQTRRFFVRALVVNKFINTCSSSLSYIIRSTCHSELQPNPEPGRPCAWARRIPLFTCSTGFIFLNTGSATFQKLIPTETPHASYGENHVLNTGKNPDCRIMRFREI